MLMECMRAQEILEDAGISAEIIDPISLIPLDAETIAKSVARTGRLLVVDNSWTPCGASAEIVSQVCESLGAAQTLQIRRMGYAATTCPTSPVLEDEFYPNPVTIAKAAHAMVKGEKTGWEPDQERAKLAYQAQFRGPF